MRKRRLILAAFLVGCVPDISDETGDGHLAGGDGACGSGAWQRGSLEIHHIDAGEGVSTLLVSPVGRSMLIDVGEADWDRDDAAKLVGDYLRRILGCRRLDYVVLSHFHVDHGGFPGHGGLWHMVAQQGFSVGRLLHRDLFRYRGTSASTVSAWAEFLQSVEAKALSPQVAVLGRSQVDLGGGVDFAFVSVDGNGLLPAGDLSSDPAPPDENDYSIAALVRLGRFDYFTAGDLSGHTKVFGSYAYHDGETAVSGRVKDVDVYRASHHGSSHSSNATLLAELDPEVTILQVADSNSNGHPAQATVERLLATSAVYLTEHGDHDTDLRAAKVSGDVVVRTRDGSSYTVAGDAFTASDPPRIDQDGDGYFVEVDPDDHDAAQIPSPNGCDKQYQACQL
jgi:competence protein ComEC